MMVALLRAARGALLLNEGALTDFKNSSDVFRRGILLMLTISLIVSLVVSVVELTMVLVAPPLTPQRETAEREISRLFEGMPELGRDAQEAAEAWLSSLDFVMEIGERIASLPRLLPRPAEQIFRTLGGLVSSPISRLGAWMFFSLTVFIVAKLLGGKATVQEMLGTTALYMVPHIAGILSPIPYLNTVAWVIATLWGVAIYVKATAVANQLDTGRALLAVFLPVLVPMFLAMVLFTLAIITALTAS